MAFCRMCGRGIPEGSRYCNHCGVPVTSSEGGSSTTVPAPVESRKPAVNPLMFDDFRTTIEFFGQGNYKAPGWLREPRLRRGIHVAFGLDDENGNGCAAAGQVAFVCKAFGPVNRFSDYRYAPDKNGLEKAERNARGDRFEVFRAFDVSPADYERETWHFRDPEPILECAGGVSTVKLRIWFTRDDGRVLFLAKERDLLWGV